MLHSNARRQGACRRLIDALGLFHSAFSGHLNCFICMDVC